MAESLKNNQDVKGKDAYIDIESGEWRQSQLFLGELYGDLKCKTGGINEYSKDKGAVLITYKNIYLANKEMLQGSYIVDETQDYIIIKNK